MRCEFEGEVWHWRGPSPYHFVTVPPEEAEAIRELAGSVTYGWGMIPVLVRLGASRWRTSLFPKDGSYLLPLRNSVRAAEGVEVGGTVAVALDIGTG